MAKTRKSFPLSFFVHPVSAIEYGGIGGRPAYPRSDEPKSSSIFIHTALPGQSLQEGIYVINNSNSSKTLLVYPTDSTPSTDGGFACKQLSEEQTKVGSWIELDQSEVILNPNSKLLVPFKINLPQNTEVGEHDGCVVVQEKKAPSTNAGINLSVRTGLRVAITIPGDIIKRLVISQFELVKKSLNVYHFRPEVKNNGNVSVEADVKVVIRNIFGREVRRFGGGYPVLRNDTSRWNFEFIKPPFGGWYSASLQVSYNNNTQDIILDHPSLSFFAPPDTLIIIIFVLALLPIIGLIIYLSRKSAKIRHHRKNWSTYKIAKGDTLMSLSERFNLTWKELAAVNNLKPPYVLKNGKTIKVPHLPQ